METDVFAEDPKERPQIDTPLLPGEDQNVDWIRRELLIAKPHVDKFRETYKQARRFYDGKQLSKEDEDILKQDGRPSNAFNSAQKFVRFITGVERNAPEALIFAAINEDDQLSQQFGENMTRCVDWAIDKGRGIFERATAFEDLVVGGMGWEDYLIGYSRDSRGLPEMARFSPLEAWFPQCDRQNLEGARWRARETYVDISEASARFPNVRFLVNQLGSSQSKAGTVDRAYPQENGITEFITYPTQTVPLKDGSLGGDNPNKLQIMQFEWFDDEEGYYFFDPLEQNDTWMSAGDFFKYRRKLRELTDLGDVTDYVKQPGRSYKRRFLLNQRYPLGDVIPLKRFHLNCMTGSYDEEDRIWYGYFQVLIDPQRFANKFFNQIIEITGRSAKGDGFLYEKGAVTAQQAQDLRDNYTTPGTNQEVSPGAISGKKMMPKPHGDMPATAVTLMQYCVQMMDHVTGISPDQFQAGGANVPGVTLRQKGKSALILLSKEFDALSRFRIDEGHIIFDLLESMADDRLIRVGGFQDGAVIKLRHEPFATEYFLGLDDTERDPNIRREYEENVMKLAPMLIRQGKFLPELLDYIRIPFRVKKKLQEAIIQQEKQEIMMAQQGIQRGGRGNPQSPQERDAKVQKVHADTGVQIARAQRLKAQSDKDRVKMIIDAVVKAAEMKREDGKHGVELAKEVFEMIMETNGSRDKAEKVPA